VNLVLAVIFIIHNFPFSSILAPLKGNLSWRSPLCENAFNDIVINFFPHLPLDFFSVGSLVALSQRGMKARPI
jgi:hypothetical protein